MKIMALVLFLLTSPLAKADEKLTFDEFWKQVKESHLGLRGYTAEIEAIKSNPALEMPAPEISLSQMNMDVPFSSKDKMTRTVELSQMVPFPTKFKVAGDLKENSVQKVRYEKLLEEKKLKEAAYSAFLMYGRNQELKDTLNSKLQFYQSHAARSRALPVTSQTYQNHLLDVDIEINSIKSEIKLAEIELATSKAMLNRFRNKDQSESVAEAELPALSEPKTLDKKSLQFHPMLKMNQFEVAAMKNDVAMARLDWAPDLSFKIRDIKSFDPRYTDGKELMIGITLPFIFPGQRNARTESLSHKARMQEYKSSEIQNELSEEYTILQNKVKEEWSLLSLYKDKILPIIERKTRLAHKLTTLDMESLDAHRMATEQFYNLRMKIIEEETNYRLAQFKLLELTNSAEGN